MECNGLHLSPARLDCNQPMTGDRMGRQQEKGLGRNLEAEWEAGQAMTMVVLLTHAT